MENILVRNEVMDNIITSENHRTSLTQKGLMDYSIGDTFRFENKDKYDVVSEPMRVTGVKYTKGKYLTVMDAYTCGWDSYDKYIHYLESAYGEISDKDFTLMYFDYAEKPTTNETSTSVTAVEKKRPLGYLGGDIMTFGSNLARQFEYDNFIERNIPVDVYSPVQNKSINDKSHLTEEENNHLAEKITSADIERLWNSDFVVMCPEQSAIGSLCETGCLYGWKYMSERLLEIIQDKSMSEYAKYNKIASEIQRIYNKQDYFHYFDIRTNHLNEKDWRRSFSINQLLYGMILYTAKNGDFETFDEIMNHLEDEYKPKYVQSIASIDSEDEAITHELTEGEVTNDR